MKVCKVKPDKNYCMDCVDMQITCKHIKNCDECTWATDTYELISVGTERVGLFGSRDYAMVLRDGIILKVDLHRVFDVKDMGERSDGIKDVFDDMRKRSMDDGR